MVNSSLGENPSEEVDAAAAAEEHAAEPESLGEIRKSVEMANTSSQVPFKAKFIPWNTGTFGGGIVGRLDQ